MIWWYTFLLQIKQVHPSTCRLSEDQMKLQAHIFAYQIYTRLLRMGSLSIKKQ